MLPSPTCGRGVGERARRVIWRYRVCMRPLPSPPAPLPQAGEGRTPRVSLNYSTSSFR